MPDKWYLSSHSMRGVIILVIAVGTGAGGVSSRLATAGHPSTTTAPSDPSHSDKRSEVLLLQKLDYSSTGPNEDWNSRPFDAADLIASFQAQDKRSFGWRTVALSAKQNGINAAPVLYLAGSHGFNFSDDQIDLLRKFMKSGGIIVANADQSSVIFRISFVDLGRALCPKHEFRELPQSHPIFRDGKYVAFNKRPVLWGLSDGKREVMILIPEGDPAAVWQKNGINAKNDAFGLGWDILEYAIRQKSGIAPGGK